MILVYLAILPINRAPLWKAVSDTFMGLISLVVMTVCLSLYLKLAGGSKHSFLLESVVGGERFGRYSFIGLPARTLLRAERFVGDLPTQRKYPRRYAPTCVTLMVCVTLPTMRACAPHLHLNPPLETEE